MTNFSSVNFQPLLDFIKSTLNTNAELSIKLSPSGGKPEIVSDNLNTASGIFAAAFTEVYVDFGSFNRNTDGFGGTVMLYFKKHLGGSNGAPVLDFQYNNNGSWIACPNTSTNWIDLK